MTKKIVLLSITLALIAGATGYSVAALNKPTERNPALQPSTRTPFGLHYSAFPQKTFFEQATANIPSPAAQAPTKIKGLVVPHHLLAAPSIAEAFQTIASDEPITVVLLSPNHFHVGHGQITSSLFDWQTPYGTLEANQVLIQQLEQKQLVTIDEQPFEKEHGISNLVAFIKQTLPNASIVPIIIKDTLSSKTADTFIQGITTELPNNTLWIASIDFSHYLPKSVADFHDATSLAVLKNLDVDAAKILEIDSRPGLRIFLQAMKANGAQQFHLFRHSNAADLINDPDLQETTSHFTGAFSLGNLEPEPQLTLLTVGDLMLDRYISQAIQQKGSDYPFERIERTFQGNDIVLANLEGCFTDAAPKALHPNNTTFTFDPALIPTLTRLGLNLVSLANNHSRDFGTTGVQQCKTYLEKNRLTSFGDSLNTENISIVKNIRGLNIGFIGTHELNHSGSENILDEIKRLDAQTDALIVFPHWGNEYQPHFSSAQQERAHRFIDAGADFVLGHHPHVIQPIEIYNNKPIIYSMGNFLFDQTFSEATQQGLAVGAVIRKNSLDLHLFPLETRNLQVQLTSQEKRAMVLLTLAEDSDVSKQNKQQILNGILHFDY